MSYNPKAYLVALIAAAIVVFTMTFERPVTFAERFYFPTTPVVARGEPEIKVLRVKPATLQLDPRVLDATSLSKGD